MNTMLCRKLFVVHPFHFRNVFSTLAVTNVDLQSHFSDLLSTKLNMSDVEITRMFERTPRLQRLQSLDNIEQFIHLLNRIGCSQAQIVKIMRVQPSLMFISAERILEPKIKLMEDFGFQGKALTKLLSRSPNILSASLENALLPKMEFLKDIFQSPDLLVRCLVRASFILGYQLDKTLKPSIAFWERWGFQGTELARFLQIQPAIMRRSSLTPAQADFIYKIGAEKGSKQFKYIVSAVAVSRIEMLEARIENLKLCGLSDEEIWRVVRVFPQVLCSSKEKIREKINFVVNNLELPANYVAEHPSLLISSLEKTMRPRFLVWQKIKSPNDPGLSTLTIFTMPEARFVKNIIKRHPESAMLWKIYQNAISNVSNYPKSSSDVYSGNEAENRDS